jgi:transcriptional regulator with XRE-family HTH domain
MPVDTNASDAHALSVELGQAIKAARGSMKQDALARAVGVDQPTISKWERGTVRPSLDDIARVEKATGRARGWVLIAAGLVDGITSTLDAIDGDPMLTEQAREMLRAAYQASL